VKSWSLLIGHTRTDAIYLTVTDDGGVLFDPRRDRLLKLNPTGVEIWTLLGQGKSASEIATTLAQRYEVDSPRVLEDIRQLLARAKMLGLTPASTIAVEPEQQPPQSGRPAFPWYAQDSRSVRPKPGRLAVLQAVLGLLLLDIFLVVSSLDAVFSRVKAWPVRRGDAKQNIRVSGQVCSAVERACVWYPRKAVCLERSIVTTCMLRSRGIAARLAVGVRSMPFLAHSWVETEGTVLNDFPRVKSFYQTIAFY
jgi:hypothetical protein